MRLKYQLFLTLLTASAVLIAIMYAISSWSFSRGFLNYVNQNEAARLSPVAERLIDRYEEEGDWLWVGPEYLNPGNDGPRRKPRSDDNKRVPRGDTSELGSERG